MTEEVLKDLKEFLTSSSLSNYEINAFAALLNFNALTAREISEISGVPTGRIYEVLEKLSEFGMVEIQESRPRKYLSLSPNLAFHNLISHLNEENQRKISYLYDRAKILEAKMYESSLIVNKETSKIFWSAVFGVPAIFTLYLENFKHLEEELLMTGFINENTIKILKYAKDFYKGIFEVINRGVRVKYLWSFEFDRRTLSSEEISRNNNLFKKLILKIEELFGLTPKMKGLEMKFVHKKIPTYYDIFDKKRVMIKLQDPSDPVRIFAGMNILDPALALELRNKYNTLWMFEALEEK